MDVAFIIMKWLVGFGLFYIAGYVFTVVIYAREGVESGQRRDSAILEAMEECRVWPLVLAVGVVGTLLEKLVPESPEDVRERQEREARKLQADEHAAGLECSVESCERCHPKPRPRRSAMECYCASIGASPCGLCAPRGRCGRPSSQCSITTCGCKDYLLD